MLSHDAAHGSSITALERHFRQVHSGFLTVNIVPAFKQGELLQTLDWACDALLGVCLGVSLLLGGTSQTNALRAIWEQFIRQGRDASA
jgi:hypothetical protein